MKMEINVGMSHSSSQKAKKQGEMPLPILCPIPSLISTIHEWTEDG